MVEEGEGRLPTNPRRQNACRQRKDGRIRNMLSHFEAQLDRFERAERPDYEILEGSIAYCQEYLDRWHHPREDALLKLLQRRAPPEARACAGLENQHMRLAGTTDEVVKIFEAVEHDAEYSRAHLVEMGRILVDDYRRHLDWEEANFFPALRPSVARGLAGNRVAFRGRFGPIDPRIHRSAPRDTLQCA